MDEQLNVEALYAVMSKRLGLNWIAGKKGAKRSLLSDRDIATPIPLAGHLNLVRPNLVQVLGEAEIKHLKKLKQQSQDATFTQIFEGSSACLLVADGIDTPKYLSTLADRYELPLLCSGLPSNELIDELRYYLATKLSEKTILHGVFLSVMDIGTMIMGDSSIGKSELALELISRGHRLVADDAPEFTKIAPDIIDGTCPPMLQDFLEVRGLGVLNIRAMFGPGALKLHKYLKLIIQLEESETQSTISEDRLHSPVHTCTVLGVDIPMIKLFVAPGRNFAVLVEAAVRNHLLQMHDYDAGDAFIARQKAKLEENEP